MDLSIIVPIYNVEGYLPACIDSLLKQDGLRLEIILVNDGSTDRSGEIAGQYANRDNRITVIHRGNGGASAARNTGLAVAQGEYILFVDSDDWIKENSLSALYHEAVKHQADMVMGHMLYFRQGEITNCPYNPVPGEIRNMPLSGKEAFIRWFRTWSYIPMAVNYLYRREYLESIRARFEEGIMYEDELWTPVALCRAQRVVAVDIDFYYYRQRKGSVIQATSLKKRQDSIFRVTGRLIAFADRFDFSGEEGELKSWLYVNIFWLYTRAFTLLSHITDTSCQVPAHHLDRFWRDCREMTPEPQKICKHYFQQAETSLKKYTDWRISDWVASVNSQLKAGKKLMLVYTILEDEDTTLNSEDIPAGWFITTDRRYFKQADAVVFHLPGLYQVLDHELEKREGQIWVSRYPNAETGKAWMENPEIRDTFDLWICERQDEERQEHPLVRLCRKLIQLTS